MPSGLVDLSLTRWPPHLRILLQKKLGCIDERTHLVAPVIRGSSPGQVNFFTLTNKNKNEGPKGEGRRIEDGGTSKANKKTSRRRTTQPQTHHRRRHGNNEFLFWKPLRGQARGKESLKTTSGGWGHFFKWGACRAGGCEAACRQGEGRHVWKGGRRVPVHPPNLTQVS